jgi:hypothetical protein
MKIIFSSMDLAAVTHLKDLLEAADIACVIKNDVSSYLTGDIAMSGVAPELWIEDESQLAEALDIKKDYLGPQATQGNAWTCPKCGEKLEAQFTTCWNCGTAKP